MGSAGDYRRDKAFSTGLTGLTGKEMQRVRDARCGPDRTNYWLRD
jgi:hypothetical protein